MAEVEKAKWYERKQCREFPLYLPKEEAERLSKEDIKQAADWVSGVTRYIVDTCLETSTDMDKVNCLHAVEYTLENACECEKKPPKEKVFCDSVLEGIRECMEQAPPSAWSPRVMKTMMVAQQILELLEKKGIKKPGEG